MAKKKWYVVIVGTSVGVFSSWLEVSPLITGVSGARHQSFATKEEAINAFTVECKKGRVRVVDASSSCGSSSSIASSPSSRTKPRRSQSYGEVPHLSPSATVQTPSGLSYYPSNRSANSRLSRTTSMSSNGTTPGRLSPLALRSPTIEHVRTDTDVNMAPLRSLRSPESGQVQVVLVVPCANCGRKAEDVREDTLSNAFSPMHVQNMVYDKKIDPRSPMPNIDYVPLSNNISFARPSPSRTPHSDSMLFRLHN